LIFRYLEIFKLIDIPPAPFKGGIALMKNPPLKGARGMSMVFGTTKKVEI
jgi:hypothetical protein